MDISKIMDWLSCKDHKHLYLNSLFQILTRIIHNLRGACIIIVIPHPLKKNEVTIIIIKFRKQKTTLKQNRSLQNLGLKPHLSNFYQKAIEMCEYANKTV